MQRLGLVLVVVAACGGSPASVTPANPAAPAASAAAPPPARFEPTAFGVEIAGSGRPVILIPGLGCPGSVWADTVAHLSGMQTHVLTLSGFAGRPPITQPLIATVRSELVAYIRDCHLDHPIVIGHSLGGFLAYALAEAEPDLVGPVVIVDAGLALGSEGGGEAMARQMRDSWIAMAPDKFAQTTRDFFGNMVTDPSKLKPLIEQVVRSDQRSMAEAFYDLMTTDLRPDAGKVRAPLLLVAADSPYAAAVTKQAALVPGSQTIVVPHTRHFVMLDDPAGWSRALDAFVAAHPAS